MSHLSQKNNSRAMTLSAVNFSRKAVFLAFIKTCNLVTSIYPYPKKVFSVNPLIKQIEKRAMVPTDISSHLMTIFAEGLEAKPRVIVELGTRGGESTFVLDKVASVFNSKMLCVDLNDCKDVCPAGSSFVQGDDIEFGKRFKDWTVKENFPSQIDLLFIDTSHEYHHTKAEIETYFPLLSDHATVMFHDTNMRFVYSMSGGKLGYGSCDNSKRDVVKAIEEYLGVSFKEEKSFIDYTKGWLVKHDARSNGLTVLKRIKNN